MVLIFYWASYWFILKKIGQCLHCLTYKNTIHWKGGCTIQLVFVGFYFLYIEVKSLWGDEKWVRYWQLWGGARCCGRGTYFFRVVGWCAKVNKEEEVWRMGKLISWGLQSLSHMWLLRYDIHIYFACGFCLIFICLSLLVEHKVNFLNLFCLHIFRWLWVDSPILYIH
jgi:hypothetical protein